MPLEFIYFGNKYTNGVKHNGDDLVGGGNGTKPNETIEINFNQIRPKVKRIICGLFIYSGASNLSEVDYCFANVSQDSEELIKYNIAQSFGQAKSVVVGEFIRSVSEWSFRATGESSVAGYNRIRAVFNSSAAYNGFESSNNVSSGSRKNFFQRIFG